MQQYHLNLLQTFNAMRIFLDIYFEQHESADIATILGSLQLCMPYNNNPLQAPTIDRAAWHDWINAVKKTLIAEGVNLTSQTRFNTQQAYTCMLNYLELFYKKYHFEDVKSLLILIHKMQYTLNDTLWQQWLLSINHAINDSYPLEVSFLQIDK